MKRIIIHWSGGGYRAGPADLRAYHRLVQGDGTVIDGLHPISTNAAPIRQPNNSATYAAHTARLNTDSIGIAFCAMHGARERPFSPGAAPITPVQLDAMVAEVARLAREYKIPITRQTVLTHAEVPITLGVAQAGKWDVTWLPGMAAPAPPVQVGDKLRSRITAATAPPRRPDPKPVTIPPLPAPAERADLTAGVILGLALAAAAAFFILN
ncbi:MAG: N-acetylmuramoyl-L-alanine amidase [Paracoccus sp. (in: a-proteobacteria)]|nr:N-acetylmuramoyl-L-alanine amidase [Paracoccus sp. (in: a-proteobacteria)]